MATQNFLLEVLSPLHIGSGQEYSALDSAYAQGRWYLIDIAKVLERSREDPTNLANHMMKPDFNWSAWLQSRKITPAEVASYSVACPVNPEKTRVRAFLRDVYERPYIPGSTLKGAIRTALLEELVVQQPQDKRQQLASQTTKQSNNKPSDRRYVARNTIERELLVGKTTDRANESNYDLLRALHVSDTEPIESDHLQIGLIWVYTLRNGQLVQKRQGGEEYKIFAEWLLTKVQTRLSVQIDTILLRKNYSQALGFKQHQIQVIRDWTALCNKRSRAIAEHEAEFYEDFGLPTIARFYTNLLSRLDSLEAQGGAILNIGWGGGWEMKTVTNPLTEGLDDEYEQIRQTFRLGRQNADIFPKTRRVAFQNNQPHTPLGWVALIPVE
ncbi:MAG: type III-A CRISPR-associated RAMP protein Csm5 [Fimbriimonadales bacterium]